MIQRIIFTILSVLTIQISPAQTSAQTSAQTGDVIIPKGIRMNVFDSTQKISFIRSLNGFLKMPSAKEENAFIYKPCFLETSALLDEIADMSVSPRFKDSIFYKCYLTNVIRQPDSLYSVQFSYIGGHGGEGESPVRASFRILARSTGDQFDFFSPLQQNTASWRSVKIRGTEFYFKNGINRDLAGEYQDLAHSFDKRIGQQPPGEKFYYCEDFQEALRLIGVEYKLDYNGRGTGSLSSFYKDTILNVCGAKSKNNFSVVDQHDLWHDRLHNFLSVETINRPVDEGCAYLYGGTWDLTWKEIWAQFKRYRASNPNADWLALYNSSYNFADKGQLPMKIDYLINALIVGKIERVKGFSPVIELLACGKLEPGNKNYFRVLTKITGITEMNFNQSIAKLMDEAN